MKILGIETSCDETALSLIEAEGDISNPLFHVLGESLISQIDIHKEFGGVFPMMAKREHVKNLIPLFKKLLEQEAAASASRPVPAQPLSTETAASLQNILEKEQGLIDPFLEFIKMTPRADIDAIAVTVGPGLEPALWVGINFARALSFVWNIPIITVNHMEGHIVSALLSKESFAKLFPLKPLQFPALALLISGGHTELIKINDWMKYEKIGQTRDDAVGEAYDKVARMMNLPYPGGPEISKLADLSRHSLSVGGHKTSTQKYTLPRPMLHSKDYDFSFSGLKTSVLYLLKTIPEQTEEIKEKISEEFENSVTEVLITKTKNALEEFGINSLILGGGVVANRHIRETFLGLKNEFPELQIHIPELSLTTDNAIMIAIASYFKYLAKPKSDLPIKANGNLNF